MIKRRFYRYEHGDKDAASGSSSSSSGSEVEAEATDDTDIDEEDDDEVEVEEEKENVAPDVREGGEASSSSGYESEDSSVNEVNLDSSGLPTSDEDTAAQVGTQNIIGSFSGGEGNSLPAIALDSPKKDETDFDTADCILKHKSVFKCRLCPRIVCLSEETLKAHLISKKHIRSEKLLREGRLKLMLNERGEIEGEVYSEHDAPTTASRQKSEKPNKKGKGHLKQKKRPRQDAESRKAKRSTEKREKRRKNED
ncbi:aspartic and glutamic acid-rich protein [Salvia divinorum]|uniref:Aspartic and glutamic acid-rich protein n=1 Tax=Salvia divinorum TaxID=28513 RepID=A0ABD1FZN2_SALDI